MTLEQYRESEAFQKNMDRMSRDLLFFGKVCVPDMFKLPSPPFHTTFRNLAQNTDLQVVNIIAPRDSAKSSIFACLLPLWHIFLEDTYLERERFAKLIPIVSKTQRESIRRLRTIKNILGNENTGKQSKNFVAHFGDWGSNTATIWREDEVILRDGTVLLALGMEQQARGLKEDHQRPTLEVFDDPEDEKNTKTVDSMEKNLDVFLNGYLHGLAKGGRAYVIGTPLNEKCMVLTLHRMAKSMDNWHSSKFKFLNENKEGVPYSIWPERLTVKELLQEKEALYQEGRVYSWYQERQCEISGREDQLISEEDILYWDGDIIFDDQKRAYLEITHLSTENNPTELAELEEPRKVPVNLFMGVDPAATVSERADHSVILTRAYDADENHYIVDMWRQQAFPHDVAYTIVMKYLRFRHTYSQVESQVYQEMLRQEVLRLSNENRVYIAGLEDKAQSFDSKSNRYLASMQSHFKRKSVYVKKEHRALVDEALLFKLGKKQGQRDDTLDALYWSMRHSYKPQHTADMLENEKRKAVPHWRKRSYDPKRDWKVS